MAPEHFDFGKNWTTFLERCLNKQRIAKAKESFDEFCGPDALREKSFVDAVCGGVLS